MIAPGGMWTAISESFDRGSVGTLGAARANECCRATHMPVDRAKEL